MKKKKIAMNKKGDMFFVIEDNGTEYSILKVCYSKEKAKQLLNEMIGLRGE